MISPDRIQDLMESKSLVRIAFNRGLYSGGYLFKNGVISRNSTLLEFPSGIIDDEQPVEEAVGYISGYSRVVMNLEGVSLSHFPHRGHFSIEDVYVESRHIKNVVKYTPDKLLEDDATFHCVGEASPNS